MRTVLRRLQFQLKIQGSAVRLSCKSSFDVVYVVELNQRHIRWRQHTMAGTLEIRARREEER